MAFLIFWRAANEAQRLTHQPELLCGDAWRAWVEVNS